VCVVQECGRASAPCHTLQGSAARAVRFETCSKHQRTSCSMLEAGGPAATLCSRGRVCARARVMHSATTAHMHTHTPTPPTPTPNDAQIEQQGLGWRWGRWGQAQQRRRAARITEGRQQAPVAALCGPRRRRGSRRRRAPLRALQLAAVARGRAALALGAGVAGALFPGHVSAARALQSAAPRRPRGV